MAICLTGDDFADPSLQFSEVQLVATDTSAPAMHALVNANVHVVLSKAIAAETGHHHRPLVAWVAAISSMDAVTDRAWDSGSVTEPGTRRLPLERSSNI